MDYISSSHVNCKLVSCTPPLPFRLFDVIEYLCRERFPEAFQKRKNPRRVAYLNTNLVSWSRAFQTVFQEALMDILSSLGGPLCNFDPIQVFFSQKFLTWFFLALLICFTAFCPKRLSNLCFLVKILKSQDSKINQIWVKSPATGHK